MQIGCKARVAVQLEQGRAARDVARDGMGAKGGVTAAEAKRGIVGEETESRVPKDGRWRPIRTASAS